VPTGHFSARKSSSSAQTYDVQAAAAAILRSGQPRALEVVDTLFNPPSPDGAAAEFESMRGG
jgi:hypothetical protein